MDEIFIENEWEFCPYIECIYYEHDTGYREFECTFLNHCVCNISCPFEVKYHID